MPNIEKVAVFGLDCAEPSLVFDRWIDELPAIRGLIERGTYGTLTSCLPPITVPAWSCMTASKDPGTLGIYGFRNRSDHSYGQLGIATSLAVREPRLWDILSQQGRASIIVGVPGTYPITRAVNGCLITSFLTPDTTDPTIQWTHPPDLRDEITALVGEYMVDVKGFRTDDKDWLLRQIHVMTEKRFKVVRHLLATRPWDLFFMVEMGVDRIHHGFWSFMDSAHHRYRAGNPYERAIRDYYRYVDSEIARTLELIDLDRTTVWIVSDHGAKGMVGGVLFNQWLVNEGYLVFREPATARRKFSVADVDWTRTRAWGDGGYYGRLFINVVGREPQGCVPPGKYESFRDELIRAIEAMTDPQGRPMGNRAYRPQDIYERVNGVAPDLIVIFGDLRWRSVGWVGSDSIYTFENDTGPDDANHAQEGLYVVAQPGRTGAGRRDGASIYDVAPTILTQLGIPAPPGMKGRCLPAAT
jgi:predicted AlkP superfamily phosphohydrolase/phosphomutase